MIFVQSGHHPTDEVALGAGERLNVVQNALGPVQLLIVGDHDHAFPHVTVSLHAPLHKDVHALAIVAGTPGRIGVEAVESADDRERVQTIVERCVQAQSFLVCEPLYRTANALVAVADVDCGWAVGNNLACIKVGNADAYGVTIANKCESLTLCPPGNYFTLEDHVTDLHVNLVELPQW